MPRVHRRTKPPTSPECLKNAVKAVIEQGLSVRASAKEHAVKKSNLANYVKKALESGIDNVKYEPNFKKSQVFSEEIEKLLEDYLLMASALFHGLTPAALRRLAYEYALRNNVKMPKNWETPKCAGPDWLSGFLKRHPCLSIRVPEATSLARMTAFNPNTVKLFMDKLETVKSRHHFTPDRIFNLDEVSVFRPRRTFL